MTKWCSCCEKWSALPVDAGQGGPGSVACEHCGAPLGADHRYALCPECGRHHRAGYEVCPNRVEENVPVALFGGADTYAVVPKKRSAKRGDEYYWQLFMDYGDKPATGDAAIEEPPHPALAYENNGNGHAPAEDNGTAKPYAGNGGNGNGNGHSRSHNGIDLAIMDSAPMTLFSEDGLNASAATDAAPVKVSAGNYNDFDYELINDPSRLAVVAEMLAQETVLGIDTETTGLDPHTSELLLLQISTADKVYIVDCKRLVPLALKPLLESSQVLKIAQNAKFEYEMLRQQAGITLSGLFDTMLAERLVMAGIGREISLKAIAQKYIGAVLDKSVRESFYKTAAIGDAYLAPEQLHYAARDAFIMLPIWRDQVRELKKHGLEQVADLEFRCIAAVGDMELAGVKIDEARWRKIIEDVAVQRDRSATELADMLQAASMQATMFGVSAINLNSNTQLLDVFGKLGVDLPDTMEATLVKYDHPAIKKLLEYRGFEKTLSAFGENVLSLINPKTGRIHPDFNQYGADTGRFSCLAGETLISTTHGLRRIDAIQAGDMVQTSYGPKRVLAAWCNGERPLVKVTLSDGRMLRLTVDHRVLTGSGDIWRAVEELSVGDEMFLSLDGVVRDECEPAPQINIDPGTSHVKHKATIPNSLSVPLCELAGLITADGTFVENRSHRVIRGKRGIRFTSAFCDRVVLDFAWEDDELIEKVKQYSMALFGLPFIEHRHKTARRLQLASTQVSNTLANLGLAGKAHTKAVPEVILTAPTPFQAAYLRGLFEGDGHISKEGEQVGLTSVNRRLLEMAQTMLSFLGCYATLRKRNDSSGFNSAPRYQLEIPGRENIAHFMSVVGFMSSRKNGRASNTRRRSIGSVTAIRVSGPKLYREAVSSGLIAPSRKTIKPFVPLYKGHRLRTATLDDLLDRWGSLPELRSAKLYRQRNLHAVQILSIEADGTGPVYDLTVSDVNEFLANGIVVHNCTKPNVQQIPATSDFRKCFVAAPGYKLVTCDYSQCELRVLAELSGDEGFVSAFISGQDLHTLTASQMFGVPLEEVQKPQRSAAKAINFGLAYGMGPGGLAPRLGVSLDEAKDLISKYFKAYPGVQKWLDKAAKDSVRLGYSITTLGRKRFYNIPDDNLKRLNEDDWRKQIAAVERQGKNSPIQGANADMTKLALIYLRSALKDWDARTVNTVHDEIVVEVREDQAEEVKHIVEREMVRAGQAILKIVPIVAEASLADYWSK